VKIPPNFPEGERALLGACLLDNGIIPEAISLISESSFYLEAHRITWRAIVRLAENDVPVDLVSLTDCLKRMGKLDSVNGGRSIIELLEAVPSSANWRHYCEAVAEKARLRHLLSKLSQLTEECRADDGNSTTILESLQEMAYESVRDTERKKLEDIGVILREYSKMAENGDGAVLMSGISTIDNIVGGFGPGVHAIAGRPSSGKTALALTMMRHMARQTLVAFFSMEMDRRRQVMPRLLAGESRVDSYRIRKNLLDSREQDAVNRAKQRINELTLYIDDTPAQSVVDVRAKVKELTVREGLPVGAIFVDHLGLGKPRDPKASMYQQVSQMSGDYRELARELEIPVFLLIQLSRAPEQRPLNHKGRMPRISDLRDSGNIEQDITTFIGLYRPSMYASEMTPEKQKEAEGMAIANIAKSRDTKIGEADLTWHGPTTTFFARVPDGVQEPYMGVM
jgi:replicative DNA helicase